MTPCAPGGTPKIAARAPREDGLARALLFDAVASRVALRKRFSSRRRQIRTRSPRASLRARPPRDRVVASPTMSATLGARRFPRAAREPRVGARRAPGARRGGSTVPVATGGCRRRAD